MLFLGDYDLNLCVTLDNIAEQSSGLYVYRLSSQTIMLTMRIKIIAGHLLHPISNTNFKYVQLKACSLLDIQLHSQMAWMKGPIKLFRICLQKLLWIKKVIGMNLLTL
mgnify:FL=1